MDLFQAFILGVVEGVSEFLPISSTAHLILTTQLLGIFNSEFIKTFEIAIQLGAILAVVVFYWRRFAMNWAAWKKILTAFLPTAVLGFILYKIVKKFLMVNVDLILMSLFFGGFVLLLFECFHKENPDGEERIEDVSYLKAVFIGVFQALAMIPGVSRSAATIIGGQWIGLKRKTIVEFSFLLAVPTMMAATTLDILKYKSQFSLAQFEFLLVGFATAFVVALLVIKFLIHFIQKHNFVIFGIYRMFIAVFFWVL